MYELFELRNRSKILETILAVVSPNLLIHFPRNDSYSQRVNMKIGPSL